jgi:hypothetical protein
MSTQRMIRNEARRFVCLTASLTEIIYALGLADRLRDFASGTRRCFFYGSDRTFIPCLANDPEWQRLQAVQAGRLHQFDCGLTCRKSLQ